MFWIYLYPVTVLCCTFHFTSLWNCFVTNGVPQTQQECFGSLVRSFHLCFLCFGVGKSCTTSLEKLRKTHFQIKFSLYLWYFKLWRFSP